MSEKVLVMTTDHGTLRSDAYGWTCEDSSLYGGEPIGVTTSAPREFHAYPNVMAALHAGWRLLAPPQKYKWKNQDGEKFTGYEWWLVKEAAK